MIRANGGSVNNDRDELAARFEAEAVPHFQILTRIALYLVRNQTEAEDLVQETLVQALNSFDRYESGTNCRAWLCKIMFRKRIRLFRANSRFCSFDENQPPDFAAVSSKPLLSPHYMGAKISLALLMLPEKFREIVWLAEVEEFTYREIAGQLKIPIGTVMSRLHRGRKMLRDKFNLHSESSSRRINLTSENRT